MLLWLRLRWLHLLRLHAWLTKGRLLLGLLLLLKMVHIILLRRSKAEIHVDAIQALLRLYLSELCWIEALHHGVLLLLLLLLLRLHVDLPRLLRLIELCAWWNVGAHRLDGRLLKHLQALELRCKMLLCTGLGGSVGLARDDGPLALKRGDVGAY